MTNRTVLWKKKDGSITVVGDYDGNSARAAQNAALADLKNEELIAQASEGAVQLAAPPANSAKFEDRGIKPRFT